MSWDNPRGECQLKHHSSLVSSLDVKLSMVYKSKPNRGLIPLNGHLVGKNTDPQMIGQSAKSCCTREEENQASRPLIG